MRIPATLALVVAFLMPASALAKNHTYAPPGNSGVNQYVESVPTAGGKKPVNSVHTGGAGGGGGGGGGSSSSIPTSTQQQFARQGAAGKAAAALAQATAPSGGSSSAHKHGAGRSGTPAASGPATPKTSTRTAAGFSPVSSLFKTFTGSTAGGLGALLPIILIVSAVGAAALGVLRRRRPAERPPA